MSEIKKGLPKLRFEGKKAIDVEQAEFGEYDPEIVCGCPPGKSFFIVDLKPPYNPQLITRADDLAVEETQRIRMSCGIHDDNDQLSDKFVLAHALEHLAMVDLVDRGIVKNDQSQSTGARTVDLTDSGITGFWFKKNLASEKELSKSVKNALGRIKRLL